MSRNVRLVAIEALVSPSSRIGSRLVSKVAVSIFTRCLLMV
jgi:hypothetical protein